MYTDCLLLCYSLSQHIRQNLGLHLGMPMWVRKGIQGINLLEMYGAPVDANSISKDIAPTSVVLRNPTQGVNFSREALRKACWNPALNTEIKLPPGKRRKYTRPLASWEKERIINMRLVAAGLPYKVMEVINQDAFVYQNDKEVQNQRVSGLGLGELLHVDEKGSKGRWIKCPKGYVPVSSKDGKTPYLRPFTLTDQQKRSVLRRTHYTHVVHRKIKIKIFVGGAQAVACEVPAGLLLNDDVYSLDYVEEKMWVLHHYCYSLHQLDKDYIDKMWEPLVEKCPALGMYTSWEWWFWKGRIGIEFASSYGINCAARHDLGKSTQSIEAIPEEAYEPTSPPRELLGDDAHTLEKRPSLPANGGGRQKVGTKGKDLLGMSVTLSSIRELSTDEKAVISDLSQRDVATHVVMVDFKARYDAGNQPMSITIPAGLLLDENKLRSLQHAVQGLKQAPGQEVEHMWVLHEYGYCTHQPDDRRLFDGLLAKEAWPDVKDFFNQEQWKIQYAMGFAQDYGVNPMEQDEGIVFRIGDMVMVVEGSTRVTPELLGCDGKVTRLPTSGRMLTAMVDIDGEKFKFRFSSLKLISGEQEKINKQVHEDIITLQEDQPEGALKRTQKLDFGRKTITFLCPLFKFESKIAAGTSDGAVCYWIDSKMIDVPVHTKPVTSMCQMWNATVLAVGFADGLVAMLDIAKKFKKIHVFRPYEAPITLLSYTYMGKRLIVASGFFVSLHWRKDGKTTVQIPVNQSHPEDSVIDVKMISKDLMVVATSLGFITVFRINEKSKVQVSTEYHRPLANPIHSVILDNYLYKEAWPQPIQKKVESCSLHGTQILRAREPSINEHICMHFYVY
uniref:Uncharacterized protein n=1 Tax=Lotharella globosa TaxID=91324 RepID=A0A7S3YX22_9EUKA